MKLLAFAILALVLAGVIVGWRATANHHRYPPCGPGRACYARP